MSLTTPQRQQMDAAIAHVEHLLREAEWASRADTLFDTALAVLPGWSVLDAWLGEDTSNAIKGNTTRARPIFEEWAGVRTEWVSRGVDGDGAPYTLEHWLSLGQALASQLGDAGVRGLWESTAVGAPVVQTVEATVQTVATGAQEAAEAVVEAGRKVKETIEQPWGWGPKLLLGGAAAVVALGVTGYAVRAFR